MFFYYHFGPFKKNFLVLSKYLDHLNEVEIHIVRKHLQALKLL